MLGIMWCLARLPYRWQMGLGRLLGRLMGIFARRRRHIAQVNLSLCFPELSDEQRHKLLHAHLECAGMALVETAMAWWTPQERLRPLLQVEGLEHISHALEKGQGAILLIGHFSYMELVGRLLSLHLPLNVTYRKNKNPLYETALRYAHQDHCTLIPHTDIRAMLHVLKRNQLLWYAPDQNYAGKHSAFVPFFGIPASTITATSRIAESSGAPVIPVFPEHLPHDRGYRITLQAPLENFPSGDMAQDAQRINEILEQQIRRIPEQYLWVHRRFKTRPSGEAGVYTR